MSKPLHYNYNPKEIYPPMGRPLSETEYVAWLESMQEFETGLNNRQFIQRQVNQCKTRLRQVNDEIKKLEAIYV